MVINYSSIIKIVLAAVIGGTIGIERERANRPAGFRTHILVCLAAAIIMDINLILTVDFPMTDPTRLGAQVISGIGFLGAGTIIKEGPSVKGLTTAASLWSVACLGLVIGSGNYLIAIASTFVIFFTLKSFNRLEAHFMKEKRSVNLSIISDQSTKRIHQITTILNQFNCRIEVIDITKDDSIEYIELLFELPKHIESAIIIDHLVASEGIQKVSVLHTSEINN